MQPREPEGPDVPGAYGAVRALDGSADDRWLAIQSGDDLVRLVDLEARALVGGALDGHSSGEAGAAPLAPRASA